MPAPKSPEFPDVAITLGRLDDLVAGLNAARQAHGCGEWHWSNLRRENGELRCDVYLDNPADRNVYRDELMAIKLGG